LTSTFFAQAIKFVQRTVVEEANIASAESFGLKERLTLGLRTRPEKG
jgi:hypothetical protein